MRRNILLPTPNHVIGSQGTTQGTTLRDATLDVIARSFEHVYVVSNRVSCNPDRFGEDSVTEDEIRTLSAMLSCRHMPTGKLSGRMVPMLACASVRDFKDWFPDWFPDVQLIKNGDVVLLLPVIDVLERHVEQVVHIQGLSWADLYSNVLLRDVLDLNVPFEALVRNLEDIDYWHRPQARNLNLTGSFKERRFDGSVWNLDPFNTAVGTRASIQPCAFEALVRFVKPNERRHLLLAALMSPSACHLVLGSGAALQALRSEMASCAYAVRYVLTYAWLGITALEERLADSNEQGWELRECLFDIDSAQHLPYFPLMERDIRRNPYIALPAEHDLLLRNAYGVKHHYVDHDIARYGIVDLATFKQRLNAFLLGSAWNGQDDILCDLDWSDMAITGACMACCIPRHTPLMAKFDGFASFAADCYEDCNAEFIVTTDDVLSRQAHAVASTLSNKLGLAASVQLHKHIVAVVPRRMARELDGTALQQRLSDVYRKLSIETIHEVRVMNDTFQAEVDVRCELTAVVSSPLLARRLRFTSAQGCTLMGKVAQAFMPVERAMYDGSTLRMLASAASAYMTLTCVGFRGGMLAEDAAHCIQRYRRRGFGVVLNTSELDELLVHARKDAGWRRLYPANSTAERSRAYRFLRADGAFFGDGRQLGQERYSYRECLDAAGDAECMDLLYRARTLPGVTCSMLAFDDAGSLLPLQSWMVQATTQPRVIDTI